MKKTNLLFILCLLPLFVAAQETYNISGKIGMANAARAFLSYKLYDRMIIDSSSIKGGTFNFKGRTPAPVSATISVSYYAAGYNTRKKTADLFTFILENKGISLASADYISNSIISGSPINDANAQLKELVRKSNITDKKQLQEFYREFATKNSGTYTGLTALASSLGSYANDEVSGPVYDMFSTELKDTPLGKGIDRIITAARNGKPGGIATPFTQNDVNGKPVNLSDFKGKYVLLDFWASWCGPCRRENPNIVKSYNLFKDRNFTVLGVSLDRPGSKDAWLNAVKNDGLLWTQVSDLQGWNNSVARLYGVQAIPFNLLIDPEGKILAKNLFGENLQRKLQELLVPKS